MNKSLLMSRVRMGRMGRMDGDHGIENRKSREPLDAACRIAFLKDCNVSLYLDSQHQQGLKRPACVLCVARLCDSLFQFSILMTQKAISRVQNSTENSNFRDHSATQELSSLIPT